MLIKNSILCVDFDGTVVYHEYPKVGADVPYAVESMKTLIENGNHLILWTMRDSSELLEAVQWFKDRDITLFGAQFNPTQHRWTKSPKCYAHAYIDDAAIGCPLIHGLTERPYVDWLKIMELLGAE